MNLPTHLALLISVISAAAGPLKIEVTTEPVGRKLDLGNLLGGNVALWYSPKQLEDPDFRKCLAAWNPTLLRLPGGSWSDEFIWNGNGVRDGKEFDRSKLRNGQWQVDYSDYAPGFRLANPSPSPGALSDFHGNIDVKALHEYVRSRGAEAIVTVNAGVGTPEMAAEWVRFARKNGFKVAYWEVGNELDGEWELGHFNQDGKSVDAAEYAKRFRAFSKAMKAMDSSVKVGGPACSTDELPFVEELIRDSGDLLDFISFHTYPVLGGRVTAAQRFATADDVAEAAAKIHEWVEKYQPGRRDEIKIGVTEWHKQVMETRPTVDLTSGLWSCLFIGSMAQSGVDFANLWDMFSDTESGGHGLFGGPGEGPRAAYHAMNLWRGMDEQWLEVKGGDDSFRAFATRGGDEVSVMLVNVSNRMREIELSFGSKSVSGHAVAQRFSQREYFWNPFADRPEWSRSWTNVPIEIGEGGRVESPPMSVLRLTLPVSGVVSQVTKAAEMGEPELEILMPDSAPADLPVEGFVVLKKKGTKQAFEGNLTAVDLSTGGHLKNERKLGMETSVGRFELRPDGPGEMVVTARAKSPWGELSATKTVELRAVQERRMVVWEFADKASIEGVGSNYELSIDPAARPNQTVAAVTLNRSIGEAQKNTLIEIKDLPGDLERERIGGIWGQIGASGDLKSEDPKAAVQIVLQSNHDHWIMVGKVPLVELAGKWQELSIRLTDPAVLGAMAELYSIRLQLKADAPVTGRVYVDDLGFILRGKS
jgi:hypothetical protein